MYNVNVMLYTTLAGMMLNVCYICNLGRDKLNLGGECVLYAALAGIFLTSCCMQPYHGYC